jgi:hypothetical protein
MQKKKSIKKKKKLQIIDMHVYGIFDIQKKAIIKISLDKDDLQMDLALMGGPSESLIECEFDIKVAL